MPEQMHICSDYAIVRAIYDSMCVRKWSVRHDDNKMHTIYTKD